MTAIRYMKSLDDIKRDMSKLFDQVDRGETDIKTAAELANIAGKYLKAEQLQLAREIFVGALGKNIETVDIKKRVKFKPGT